MQIFYHFFILLSLGVKKYIFWGSKFTNQRNYCLHLFIVLICKKNCGFGVIIWMGKDGGMQSKSGIENKGEEWVLTPVVEEKGGGKNS